MEKMVLTGDIQKISRGTMHRAHNKRKTIKQEGQNSLCPYNLIITIKLLEKN